MRPQPRKPIEEMPVDPVKLELNCRADIPQILGGLQYLVLKPTLREQVLKRLEGLFPNEIDLHKGRPGMDIGSIVVMGVVRLNLNCDYDRRHHVVNNHTTIRPILGHGFLDDQPCYYVQTLNDNVSLLTPEMLDQINQVVVKAGPELIKKKVLGDDKSPLPDRSVKEKLRGRCDSFVVATNVDYPTDTRLLFDAWRKVIDRLSRLCRRHEVDESVGWGEIRRLQKRWRRLQKLQPSTATDESKPASRLKAISAAQQADLDRARE